MEMALLVLQGSQGSAGWSLQPGLSSPLQKLWMLRFGWLWHPLGVEHILAESSAPGLWSLTPAVVATLPGAAVASSSLFGFSNYGSRHLSGEDSVGVAKGLRLPGDSCLLWFGLCCSGVYPAQPMVWHMSVSTDTW